VRRQVEEESRVDMSLGNVNVETASGQLCPIRTLVGSTVDGRSCLLPRFGRR
jgi:hypothetical protein